MDGHKTLNDINKMLTDEFDIPEEKSEEDLIEYVNQLKEIDAIIHKE
jgi:hypothetical protein